MCACIIPSNVIQPQGHVPMHRGCHREPPCQGRARRDFQPDRRDCARARHCRDDRKAGDFFLFFPTRSQRLRACAAQMRWSRSTSFFFLFLYFSFFFQPDRRGRARAQHRWDEPEAVNIFFLLAVNIVFIQYILVIGINIQLPPYTGLAAGIVNIEGILYMNFFCRSVCIVLMADRVREINFLVWCSCGYFFFVIFFTVRMADRVRGQFFSLV